MSKKLYEESNIRDIASAIREQNGTQDSYTVAQMGNAVRAIKTQPDLETLNATVNGNYLPSSGKDGFSSVNVNVSGGEVVVQPLSATQNGIYNPPSGVDGYAPVTVNVQGGGDIEPELPSEYQEVEYIECYGQQYIVDSTVKLHLDDAIESHASLDSSVASVTENGIMGGNDGGTFEIYFKSRQLQYYGAASGQTVNITYDTKTEIYGTINAFKTSTPFYWNKFSLGRYSGTYWHKGKIWRTTLYVGREGISDKLKYRIYVPCYRKSDNVIGFYELITGVFLTNSGSGAFGKGPDVN